MRILLLFLFTFSLIASGCRQTSDVAGNGLIHKRKYRTGWHMNFDKFKSEQINVLSNKTEGDSSFVSEGIEKNFDDDELSNTTSNKVFEPLEAIEDSSPTRTIKLKRRKKTTDNQLENAPPKETNSNGDNFEDDEIKEKQKRLIITIAAFLLNIFLFSISAFLTVLLGLFPLMILSFTIGVALLIAIYLQNNDYSSAKIGEKYWTEERIERLAGLAKKLASISMILSYSIVALVAIAFLLASFLGISSFIFGAIVIGLGSLAVLAWMAVTSTSAGIAIETYNRSENSKKAGRSLLMQILINTLLYLVSFIVGLVLLFALSI